MRDNRAGRVLRHVYPCPVEVRCAWSRRPDRPALARRPENPVRRRWPPAGAARVSPATHTIS